jgi:hypothetical protein
MIHSIRNQPLQGESKTKRRFRFALFFLFLWANLKPSAT